MRCSHGGGTRYLPEEPTRPWTVTELARCAAVSRSTLALRFKRAVGQGPIDYLTSWRIELAAKRLLQSGDPLAVVAREVGCGSKSALSTAFKRVMGLSPQGYRRRGHT
ncbi:helix-turn-helix transcriptional regulator [Streptomyces sp. NPDC057428]|uniref:helix-turn-helix transcriptional regulator n=1 Tax=Streptomyces sp. NPDC057428 TaxID=3346129 RepID=UPI0036C83779